MATAKDDANSGDVVAIMTIILGTMFALLASLVYVQSPSVTSTTGGRFLPCPTTEPSKFHYESFVWSYTPVWIGCFAAIVIFKLYDSFNALGYDIVLGGLALPLLLHRSREGSPDASRPLTRRYSTKANLWIAVFSFVGNYWYTHYFYSVLGAEYTMPAHRFNNVPIALYFATHFYFSTYHALSNALLRRVDTTYRDGPTRTALRVGVVVVLSYFTAFMETLTISNYPYYDFEDRNMAYTVGSAFYGIYFLVSFPMFYEFDPHVDDKQREAATLWDTFVHSCGCGMIVLTCLDLVRLWVGVPLVVGS